MRRVLVAVAATLVVVVLAVTAVALTFAGRDDGGWMQARNGSMMHGGAGMHGAAAGSELSYLAHMVAHHQEAVDAARELARSDRPQMRAFGRDIVADQSAEIRQMRTWIMTWYPDRSTDVRYQRMMRDLSGLTGDRLDRVFLEDMVGHHMAAVMMSQQLLARGAADHEEVRDLARRIRDQQHREIVRMRDWLSDWFGVERREGSRGMPHAPMGW